MDRCKCYLCEKLCYCESQVYDKCQYRRQKSFGIPENRAYEDACTRLAVKFARKHGWRFEGWVGHFDPEKHTWHEGAGGHAMVSDTVFSFEDMRTDLMMDAFPDAIMQYYDECVEEGMKAMDEGRDARYVNYRNWLLGARCNPEDETLEYKQRRESELREELIRLEETHQQLLDTLKEQCQKDADDLLAGSDGLY